MRQDLELRQWLAAVHDAGRSAKIDLKEDGNVLHQTLEEIARLGWRDEDLWFNGAVEIPGRSGFERLAAAHPGARRSCPLDTLASYLREEPAAFTVVDALEAWGLDWLCFGAKTPGSADLVGQVQARGWRVNVWDVSTAREFQTTLAVGPHAITADLGSIPPDVWMP